MNVRERYIETLTFGTPPKGCRADPCNLIRHATSDPGCHGIQQALPFARPQPIEVVNGYTENPFRQRFRERI